MPSPSAETCETLPSSTRLGPGLLRGKRRDSITTPSVVRHFSPKVAYVDAPRWASPVSEPSRWQSGQVLSYVRPLDAALVGRGPVWCS